MKKYILSGKIIIFLGCLILSAACSKDNGLDTDQYAGDQVIMKVFGPCPIARGGELRIYGANLDKIRSVTFTGSESPVTVSAISKNEIRVTVPQDAQVGIITLTGDGIKIESKTELTFAEPISIDAITPITVKPGGTITIEGEYLNLIGEIIFFDDIHVLKTDFISQSRQSIELKVPPEAQTGKIIVSDGADLILDAEGNPAGIIPIWVYSDDPLVVIEPAITSLSPLKIKAGDVLTITGTDLDLVKAVKFSGGTEVTEFTVNGAGTVLTVKVPVDSKDGEVTLIAMSDVETDSETLLDMIVPSVTALSPQPVKCGTLLTITGVDLDLVTNIRFPNVSSAIDCKTQTATQITIDVPPEAADGELVFNTNSGKTVEAAFTTVKFTVTSVSPIVIMAGEPITITGTNLDLVAKVIFGGNTEGVILKQDATSIEVESLLNSLTDAVILAAANGTEVKTQEITINSELPVVTFMPDQVKPGALLEIVGTKLHLTESIIFPDNVKAVKYGMRSETLIEVYVPDNVKRGKVTLILNTFDEKEVISPEITIAGTDPVTDLSLVIFDFEDRGGNNVANNSWGGIGEKSTNDGVSGAFYEVTAAKPVSGGWQWGISDNWCEIGPDMAQVSGISNYVLKMDVRFRNDIPVPGDGWANVEFRMAGSDKNITSYLKEGNMFTTGGEWKTISIPLTALDLPDPTPVGGDWGLIFNQGGGTALDFVGLCVDNIRYEKIP